MKRLTRQQFDCLILGRLIEPGSQVLKDLAAEAYAVCVSLQREVFQAGAEDLAKELAASFGTPKFGGVAQRAHKLLWDLRVQVLQSLKVAGLAGDAGGAVTTQFVEAQKEGEAGHNGEVLV